MRASRPHVQARRTFRLALTTSLALAVAYAMALPMAFLAPLLAFMLAAPPGRPIGLKGLLGLIVAVCVTLGIGLLMIPALVHYPVAAVLVVGLGLYAGNYLMVIRGKGLVGALVALGFTLIPAAGTIDFGLAVAVIKGMVIGIAVAILSHWVAYPLFPEDDLTPAPKKPPGAERSSWIALRATLVVLPPFLLCLTNPQVYMPLIMKSLLLGQQASLVDARSAGRELLGSTFLAGCYAVGFWFLLKLAPNLWMFFLLMLLFGVHFAAKLYRVVPTRFPPSFWSNVAVTMLILVGPAVADSANGKDPYKAFAIRMGLFIAVTLYAWAAVAILERVQLRREARRPPPLSAAESA